MRWQGPLLAVLAIQTTVTFIAQLAPTTGPRLMALHGWPESAIGFLSTLVVTGSIAFLLAGTPLIWRMGSIRSLQICLLIAAAGACLLALPIAFAPAVGSLLIGLGYGPSASAGSDVLLRYSPPGRRNLIFSIKQAGVPIGGAAAALILPALTERFGLNAAIGFAAGLAVVTAFAVQALREEVDRSRNARQPLALSAFLSVENLTRPLVALGQIPALRRVGAAGAFLAVGQGIWFAYLITFLVVELQMPLAKAGAILAVMQTVSTFGRPFLGWLSDHLESGTVMLRWVAVASASTSAVLSLSSAAWPAWAFVALAVAGGLTVSSWNGVQVSTVAQLAPEGKIAETTAGGTILVFIGYWLGPMAFAFVVSLFGRFDVAFGLTALVTLCALIPLMRAER